MELFLLSFILFGLAVSGMAVSVLFGRPELKGTCASLGGGIGTSRGCEICPHRPRQGASGPAAGVGNP